tara:strand:+ start:235 stop:1974 length:1740 start_codon:yes stop_codon:yes gene_type:complete
MKIFYSAVFDNDGISSDTSKARELENLGHEVISYNYRIRGEQLDGHPLISPKRDEEIISFCKLWQPDYIIFAKCNGVDIQVFHECKDIAPVCYWFADPLVTYSNNEFYEKTKVADIFTCDKKNVLEKAQTLNSNCHITCDGFDSILESPKDVKKQYDVSFIGNLYGDRAKKISSIKKKITNVTDAYGEKHSLEVSKSKINLNFCTSAGPSDRVFKVLAAGGFLLTDEWTDRVDYFEDGKDLVVFSDIDDLNNKIEYYLQNPDEREKISAHGFKTVQNYTRKKWAEKTCNLINTTKRNIKRSKKQKTTLIAGPWVGEFGWELFCWQGYIRSMSKFYDETICISSPHSKFLYEDFCNKFIEFIPDGGVYKDSFFKAGYNLDNITMKKLLEDVNVHESKVSLFLPRRIGDPPRTHFSEKFQFGPLYIGPQYKKLGNYKEKYKNAVLFHARNRSLRKDDNWSAEKWGELNTLLKSLGYETYSVGLKTEALYIEGTEDIRECDQQELLDIMNSARCIFGQSSGAMHLASLCGCPQVIWSTNYNFDRYTKNWNPFESKVLFLSEMGWQPSVEYVYQSFLNNEELK